MKVRCIRNNEMPIGESLTIGFTYDVLEKDSTEYKIMNDEHNTYWYGISRFELVTEKENMFTKKDLRSGMVVEMENGDLWMVIISPEGKPYLFEDGNFDPLSYWDENLDYNGEFPIGAIITKVYSFTPIEGTNLRNKIKNALLVWERKPAKEMTVEELELILGYKVKIIGDK
jgi:hypothetical protein